MSDAAGPIHAVPTILVVDDDATTRAMLKGVLLKEGYLVHIGRDAEEGLDLARRLCPDLILLDVNLPGRNGLDACRVLKSQPETADIPVLFLSAREDVSLKLEGFAAGGTDYITKPCHPAELLSRVRTHLRLRQAYRMLTASHVAQVRLLADSQRSFMPRPEDLPHARFAVDLRQAHKAGGDFYDVFSSGNQTVDYVVADGSGHDLGVSLWTVSFKALLTQYASILHAPQEICRLINGPLQRVLPEGMYFSAIYARLNRASKKLALANAGHPPAILVSAATGEATILRQDGDLLGVFADAAFGEVEIPLNPGDRVFLYSDGLVEPGGSREAGILRLADLCQSTFGDPLGTAIPAIVNSLVGPGEPEDDTVLLGIAV